MEPTNEIKTATQQSTDTNTPLEVPIGGTVSEIPAATPAQKSPVPRINPEIIVALVVVVLGGLLLLGLRFFFSQKTPPPVVIVKSTPTPTPTPTRLPSALATQSAFLKLDANVASLSSSINNYVVDDPSLSPPVIELPLGFQ